MEYMIDSSPVEINFAPTPVEEVLQNVKFILLTVVGSVPLDRKFGVTGLFVDKPTEIAKAMLSAEIFENVHRNEPRVTVKQVAYRDPDREHQGRLLAEVKVEIDA